MAQVGSDKQINATLVEDAEHVNRQETELVTRAEDLSVTLETNSLHLCRLIELVHRILRPEILRLLHHSKHIGFVLQLHGNFEHYILYVIGKTALERASNLTFEKLGVEGHLKDGLRRQTNQRRLLSLS